MECAKCGQPKETSRAKSSLCRACDSSARARRRTDGPVTAHRRLIIELPVEVWDRLDAEAVDNGQRIAGYLRHLVVKRDTRQVSRNNPE